MFIVRDTFHCKPGKAKDLVGKFKAAAPHFEKLGARGLRIMTDAITDYWTVSLEFDVDSIEQYTSIVERRGEIPALGEAMAGYMDCIQGGRREMFKLE